MVREVCFCGRQGLLIDRIPVYAGDGDWGLECPRCGNLDRLAFLTPEERHSVLCQAAERQRERISPDQPLLPTPFL